MKIRSAGVELFLDGRTDRQADTHDETNRRRSQFCERFWNDYRTGKNFKCESRGLFEYQWVPTEYLRSTYWVPTEYHAVYYMQFTCTAAFSYSSLDDTSLSWHCTTSATRLLFALVEVLVLGVVSHFRCCLASLQRSSHTAVCPQQPL
jgi:hypothetical protein